MSLFFMNQFSSIPPAERSDQNQSHLAPFTLTSATSSCSCPIFLNSTSQGQGANNRDHHLLQQEPKEHVFISKSSDHLLTFPTKLSNNNNNTMEESSREYPCVSHEDLHGPASNWMSSKMRFMRKMMNSDHVSKPRRNIHILQDQVQPNQDRSTSSSSNSLNGGIIRVCSDCNTTKTPLWRSGPLGPKSLCNACGIRQRKARRAMDTAAASGGISPREAPSKVRKEKKSDVDRTLPFKKRCKIATAAAAQKNPCFDDVLIRLGNSSSAVHRVFPQDERDAALLLMALSWGIICS